MRKDEFLIRLEQLLYDIPKEERDEALEYYRNYFDDAGIENEAAVLEELGSPQKVAAGIREGIAAPGGSSLEHPPLFVEKTKERSGDGRNWKSTFKDMDRQTRIILAVILAVFTLPIWSGIAAGLLGLVMGVIGIIIGAVVALAALSIGGVVGGIVCVIFGIARFCMVSLTQGLLLFGVGMLLLAAGCISIVLLLLLCFRAFPRLFGVVSDLLRRLWKWGRNLA